VDDTISVRYAVYLEGVGSNLGRDARFSDRGYPWFSSVTPNILGQNHKLCHHDFFSGPVQFIFRLFYAIKSEIMSTSLNKQQINRSLMT